ncbi:hypothetical protein NAPIS_ORF00520 [Vairimorpha apis BRL 01]|uniref:Uncharacterized protein n=1 Tax=Vairimorpha apis BRL 01 TaxID=1037528 RepID=T0LC86_9MICR|nr:hypothetical protein NAPIS_ORF00520 [Vairimorpha apis BRL 01]
MHKYENSTNQNLNMQDYDKINDEIKEFINMQETKPNSIIKSTTQENDKTNLISLLSELLNIYKDIHEMIESKDFQNVKDKILNTDIKNALVCESLMKILKDECQEKNTLKKEIENEKEHQKKYFEQLEHYKIKIAKIESDIEFLKREKQEISRVVKDQKNLLISTKEKAELERKNCESLKNLNKELEFLKVKAYDKCQIFENEIKVFKDKLKEKEKTIKELHYKIKEFENEKNLSLKKITNYERLNGILKNKIETKDKSLNICNEELAKFINQDKKNVSIMEDLKEKSSYYERLYKATNKQNEYLNSQLAKLINTDNVEKIKSDSSIILKENVSSIKSIESKFKNKFKKYRKKYLMYKQNEENKNEEINEIKKIIEKLKLENKRLQDEKERAISGNNKITDTLMNKVENLLNQNREYQNIIVEKDRNFDKQNESFKTVYEDEITKKQNYENLKFDKDYTNINNPVVQDVSNIDVEYEDVFNKQGHLKIKDFKNNTLFFEDTKYRRPFELENEYDEKFNTYKNETKINIPGNFYSSLINKTQNNNNYKKNTNINNNNNNENINLYDNIKKVDNLNNNENFPIINAKNFVKDKVFNNREFLELNKTNNYENENKQFGNMNKIDNNVDYEQKNTKPEFNYHKEPIIKEDAKSIESSKSIKTTSTLKGMIKKTEDLQNKFEDLERQLDEIKESEEPISKKLHDQIKAYTDYYYSDYLDLSNENDIL